MSDGFGYWFAGLVDGEGSFLLKRNRSGYLAALSIQLRDDDRETLQHCMGRLRMGKLYAVGVRIAHWQVLKRVHTRALVDILDRYPLRTKKLADYLFWREAVLEWPEGKPRDWTRIAELKTLMEEGRRYGG